MKVGLYFGTFNPVHIGHLVIANYMADYTDLDEVWMIVSPHNPLKEKKTLLADYHRLAIVREGLKENSRLKVSDVEFHLPIPSYTATTLGHLKDKHPDTEFALLMGEDNLRNFDKWMNHEYILENHKIYVYPRVLTIQERSKLQEKDFTASNNFQAHKNVIFCNDAPVMKVSSSFIRKAIKEGNDVRYLLTDAVFKYVDEMNFYK